VIAIRPGSDLDGDPVLVVEAALPSASRFIRKATTVKLAAADADSPGMAANRRYVGALCAATVLAAAGAGAAVSAYTGGTSSPSPRASRAPGVLELRVSFQGKWGSYFGPAHEWYSPYTGVFRVDGSSQGKTYTQVFDGSAWTSGYEGRLDRQAGRPAMFRWLFARPDLLGRPGVAAVDSFLGLRHSKLLRVVSRDGGHSLDGDVKLEGTAGGPVRFRVRVIRRLTVAKAMENGLFAAPKGKLVKDLRESKAGTPPQFSEPAYWFGGHLGQARAVATLDDWRWPGDVAPGASFVRYVTIYRLPASVASSIDISTHLRAYPGLGNTPPSDIRVDCSPRRPGVPVPTAVGKHEEAVVKNGERVSLTIAGYTTYKKLAGVQAQIVLGDSFCEVQGLVSPAVFRGALKEFGPVK
jgi:hypothetical protein